MVAGGGAFGWLYASVGAKSVAIAGLLLILAVVLHRWWIDRSPRASVGWGLKIGTAEFLDLGARIVLYTKPRPIKRGLWITTDVEILDVEASAHQRRGAELWPIGVLNSLPHERSAFVWVKNQDSATGETYRTEIEIKLRTPATPHLLRVRHAAQRHVRALVGKDPLARLKP